MGGKRGSVCGGWVGVLCLSSSACGEAAAPEALPHPAAGTGCCWRARCFGLPEASVASGTEDKDVMLSYID